MRKLNAEVPAKSTDNQLSWANQIYKLLELFNRTPNMTNLLVTLWGYRKKKARGAWAENSPPGRMMI
jgi:hypothetical protein